MTKKYKQISIDLTLHNEFKSYVAKKGESMKDIVERLIREEIKGGVSNERRN